MRNAAAILVGNELLSGATRDANLQGLARTLRALGIALERAVVVPDEVDSIAREVRDSAANFDVVFTSGGVGPTHDDVTVAAVAKAFDVDLIIDTSLLQAMTAQLGTTPVAVLERMAKIPIGAHTVRSDFSWPTIVMGNVWILPGVPEVFRQKLGVIRLHLLGNAPHIHRGVLCRSDELELVSSIDRVVRQFQMVSIGSYPAACPSDPMTRVTFDGGDAPMVQAACSYFVSLLPAGEVLGIEENSP